MPTRDQAISKLRVFAAQHSLLQGVEQFIWWSTQGKLSFWWHGEGLDIQECQLQEVAGVYLVRQHNTASALGQAFFLSMHRSSDSLSLTSLSSSHACARARVKDVLRLGRSSQRLLELSLVFDDRIAHCAARSEQMFWRIFTLDFLGRHEPNVCQEQYDLTIAPSSVLNLKNIFKEGDQRWHTSATLRGPVCRDGVWDRPADQTFSILNNLASFGSLSAILFDPLINTGLFVTDDVDQLVQTGDIPTSVISLETVMTMAKIWFVISTSIDVPLAGIFSAQSDRNSFRSALVVAVLCSLLLTAAGLSATLSSSLVPHSI
eukprot:765668-Hanusia_phi.AAC.1